MWGNFPRYIAKRILRGIEGDIQSDTASNIQEYIERYIGGNTLSVFEAISHQLAKRCIGHLRRMSRDNRTGRAEGPGVEVEMEMENPGNGQEENEARK